MDNGGTNFETEIGRIDHCGLVNTFEVETDHGVNVRMNGCVASCRTDGCNAAWRLGIHINYMYLYMVLAFTMPTTTPLT